MKKILFITLFILTPLFSSALIAESKQREIEFVNTTLLDVIRTLSELSNSNIIATPEASLEKVTIHLKNVTVLETIKSISQITNLWYRYDEDTDTYRIMTRKEYSQDLVVRESEHIEVFKLLNANVLIVANAIKDLFGSRVILSEGIPAGQSFDSTSNSSSNSNNSNNNNSNNNNSNNNNSNNNSSNNSSSTTANNSQLEGLSADQLSLLTSTLNGNNISSSTLQKVAVLQSQPIYITVNNEHGMILVRTDDKKVIKAIDSLVKKLDIPIPQVMLEMKILNITLGDDFNSIFNFELKNLGGNSLQPMKFGNNGLLNSGSYIYEFLSSRLSANIEFLEQNKRIKVLSNPMVLASNHREADLFIGEERLLTRGFKFNPATTTNAGVISPSFVETQTELREIGISLKITPKINDDGTVTLELNQENSTLNPGGATLPLSDGSGGIVNLPIDTVNTSRLTGTIVAHDGLTVAIGGLIRTSKTNNEKKVPILSEVPILGNVFRSTIESTVETEMILLITPRILTKPKDSLSLRKDDNPYYQSLNDNFPNPKPYPNQFIKEKEKHSSTAKHQNTYFEMSQYVAEIVHNPGFTPSSSVLYSQNRISPKVVTGLFDDNRIRVTPFTSWKRDGLYVTAVKLSNRSNSDLPIDYKNINGLWLAASVESAQLLKKAKNPTFMYLVSDRPFDQNIAEIK